MAKNVKEICEQFEMCVRKGCKHCKYQKSSECVLVCKDTLIEVIECLKEKEQTEYYIGQTLYMPGSVQVALLEEDQVFPVMITEIKLKGEHNTPSEIRVYCDINRERYSIWRDSYVSVTEEGKTFFKNKEDAYKTYLENVNRVNGNMSEVQGEKK